MECFNPNAQYMDIQCCNCRYVLRHYTSTEHGHCIELACTKGKRKNYIILLPKKEAGFITYKIE